MHRWSPGCRCAARPPGSRRHSRPDGRSRGGPWPHPAAGGAGAANAAAPASVLIRRRGPIGCRAPAGYRRLAMPLPRRTDRRDRPVALRPRRGRPGPDPHHPARRQAQGDRQGRPAADQPARRQRSSRSPSCTLHAGPRPDVRRRHPGQRRPRLARPARLARVGGHRLVPRPSWPSGRPRSGQRRPRVRPPAAGLRAARRRHGPRAGGPLVRDAPGRRARRAARGGPLRRVRPGARGGRDASAGCRRSVASCASGTRARRPRWSISRWTP